MFDKLVQILVLGVAYDKISDSTCSATTIRNRRDEWINIGLFRQLEQICLEAHDQIVGLDLENITVSIEYFLVYACFIEVAAPVERSYVADL